MMSKHFLKRRSLIHQLGAAAFLAAPVFRSVFAEAQVMSPRRLIIITFPGGLADDAKGLPDLSFTGTLAPLAPLQSDIIRIMETSRPSATGEGHSGGMRTLITGGRSAPDSIDQLVAQQIGSATRFSSLQLGVFTDAGEGMEGLFQSLMARRIAYSNGLPLTPDQDPKALFTRLFGSAAPSPAPLPAPTAGTPPPADTQALAAYQRDKSLLDYLTAQLGAIKSIAGTGEQAKLDQHLTALREMEKGLMSPSMPGAPATMTGGSGTPPLPVMPGAGCTPPTLSDAADLPKVGADMNQLAYQAINCDLTRVLTFQWMSSGDQIQRFPWLGINSNHHHGLEHGSMDPDDPSVKVDFTKCQTWFMEQIGVLLQALKNTPDGASNLLDSSAVLVSTDMTFGDHQMEPHVAFTVGKAGGAFRPGRDYFGDGKAHNNLLLTMAKAMGVNLTSIGDPGLSTGAFDLS